METLRLTPGQWERLSKRCESRLDMECLKKYRVLRQTDIIIVNDKLQLLDLQEHVLKDVQLVQDSTKTSQLTIHSSLGQAILGSQIRDFIEVEKKRYRIVSGKRLV